MKPAVLLIAALIVAGCGSREVPHGRPGPSGLVLSCSVAADGLRIGDELPPPELTITNATDRPFDLVGPIVTVVSCTLVQPDGTAVDLALAMPTGRDPADMPKRQLPAGESIRLKPAGIWYYRDGAGYAPYVFVSEGRFGLVCRYEGAASETLALDVRGRPPEAGPECD